MPSVKLTGLSSLLSLCLLAACATTPEQQAARAAEAARINAEIAARQGEAVNSVCARSSDGWRALRDDVLLLEARGDWYMLELAGACNPEAAFSAIVTRSRSGSSCLGRGDVILTGRPRRGERCTITAIHQWDEAAEVTLPAASQSAQPE